LKVCCLQEYLVFFLLFINFRPVPRIGKFCGCFDLLFGGKILGLYGFLVGIGYVMATVGVLRDVDAFEHTQKEHEFYNDNHTGVNNFIYKSFEGRAKFES
jgi:hypothetical protein